MCTDLGLLAISNVSGTPPPPPAVPPPTTTTTPWFHQEGAVVLRNRCNWRGAVDTRLLDAWRGWWPLFWYVHFHLTAVTWCWRRLMFLLRTVKWHQSQGNCGVKTINHDKSMWDSTNAGWPDWNRIFLTSSPQNLFSCVQITMCFYCVLEQNLLNRRSLLDLCCTSSGLGLKCVLNPISTCLFRCLVFLPFFKENVILVENTSTGW